MGFIDRVRQLLGGRLSPEAEAAIEDQLRVFLREKFAAEYLRRRSEGMSESVARDHMLQFLVMHVDDKGLRKATIALLAQLAQLRPDLPSGDSAEERARIDGAFERRISSRFNVNWLAAALAEEVHALETGQRPATQASPAAAAERKSKAPAQVEIQGSSFPLATSVDSLVPAIASGGRGALRIANRSYGTVLVDLMRAMEKRFGERAPQVHCVAAAALICCDCQLEFPGSFKLALQDPHMFAGGIVMGGMPGREEFARTGACPQCRKTESYLVYEYVSGDDVTKADVEAIRDYWRELACEWWAAGTRANAICDHCNGALERDQGYLSGSSLICEDCLQRGLMAEGLSQLRRNPDYYGNGLLRKARTAALAHAH